MSAQTEITLLLNDAVETVTVPPGLVALDFLRKRRRLTGSKEGCKEGDCGACTTIVGTLEGDRVSYQPMTSCLLPMGELHGKHLVSIEGLNMETLSPIQEAMVENGGTQCGYCTPGFVVAMTAGLMDEKLPLDRKGCDYAISGNLCRCTGYRSIKQAGLDAIEALKPMLADKPRAAALCQAGALPTYFEKAATALAGIPPKPDDASPANPPIVAGGTDLFVQRGEELPEQDVTLLNQAPVLPASEMDGQVCLDAKMSFEDFARDPLVRSSIPGVSEYNELIASWPVRTRATLAGNICNASPIADMTCLLIALDATLILESPGNRRELGLSDFYLGYKQLAKEPHEIITAIRFPKPGADTYLNWEKVSKRRVLDIATVNSAIRIRLSGEQVAEARLALGGVAATPLYLRETSRLLEGRSLDLPSVLEVVDAAQQEFTPISDVRGSAHYKRLLARQLMLAHFTKLFPERLKEEALYEALR